MRVVLASASPRRTHLLSLVGIEHEVVPAHVDESVLPGEAPAAYVERVARAKAMAGAAMVHGALVIAADTTVVLDGRILAKPESEAHAVEMLTALAGRTHTVLTGAAAMHEGALESGVDAVEVTFRALTRAQVEAYVSTGEPMDKAGSYGIQGFGATIVERIDGDFFAVMGLSLVRVVALLQRLGIPYSFGPLR